MRFATKRTAGALLLLALLPLVSGGRLESADTVGETRQQTPLLLGESYPIETSISFHAALLHWLDSIAALNGPGMTAGKTVEAHRREYEDRLGALDPEDIRALRRYADVRLEFAQKNLDSADSLAAAFFEATTLDGALAGAGELLDDAAFRRLRASLDYFTPGYRDIWRQGSQPARFLQSVLESPDRDRVLAFLLDVARFYGVDARRPPNPRLVLAPVRSGHGTHAQALGRYLLIEVREEEGLTDQVGPIVHENAHFLYGGLEPGRREALQDHAARLSADGPEAFRVLQEALPTAIAQGVAEERFRPDWEATARWYHVDAVDVYAKRIFPLVKRAIESERTLDEALLGELIEAYRP